MTEQHFAGIIQDTKKVVLSAVQRYLEPDFFWGIDDVVQEIYLRAFKALQKDQFRGEAKLATWLYTIARNECLRFNQKQLRELRKQEKMQGSWFEEDYRYNPIEMDNEQIETMRQLVRSLPDPYREVLELTASGLSQEEISGRLGIEVGTVKSRSFRGREILKKIWPGEVSYETAGKS